MKKSITLVAILVTIIASLPMIGNSFIKATVDARLDELKSFGIETTVDIFASSYLHSSRHMEFILTDSNKLINHLNLYSNRQIPPYVNAILDGIVLGFDIKYSNFPFAKAMNLELYPLTMSQKMKDSLIRVDENIYSRLAEFIKSKGLLYHIKYNLINQDFSGSLKDVDESYSFKDGSKVNINLKKALFYGTGELIAPKKLRSNIENFQVFVVQKDINASLNLDSLSSTSNFESKHTYLSGIRLKHLELLVSGTDNYAHISMEKMKVNTSSNSQGEMTELNSKSSLKSLKFSSNTLNLNLQKFNFDIALSKLNKESFEELSSLFSKTSTLDTEEFTQKTKESIIKLLSKGLVLNIANFSIKNIILNEKEELNGFEFKSKVSIKEDDDIGQKLLISPLFVIEDLDVNVQLKVSNELYAKFTKNRPLASILSSYATSQSDDVAFDVTIIDSKVLINGKPLN